MELVFRAQAFKQRIKVWTIIPFELWLGIVKAVWL